MGLTTLTFFSHLVLVHVQKYCYLLLLEATTQKDNKYDHHIHVHVHIYMYCVLCMHIPTHTISNADILPSQLGRATQMHIGSFHNSGRVHEQATARAVTQRVKKFVFLFLVSCTVAVITLTLTLTLKGLYFMWNRCTILLFFHHK